MKYDKEYTGKIIRTERKKRKWTQEKLSEKLDVSSKQVSKYESGELFPPLNTLIDLCCVFECEIGYLLGEPQYEDGTQLTTAIHEATGLTSETIKNIQCITGKNRGPLVFKLETEKYTQILNRLLSSANFLSFIECLGQLDNCENELKTLETSMIEKYGMETFNTAIECYTKEFDYEHAPNTEFPSDKVCEAYKCIGDIINQQQDILYKIKVSRYELYEVYEELINDLYPKR